MRPSTNAFHANVIRLGREIGKAPRPVARFVRCGTMRTTRGMGVSDGQPKGPPSRVHSVP